MNNKPVDTPIFTPVHLGPVETEIMYLVWDLGTASVRDIVRLLNQQREIAYTTVMTIMTNLVNKGVLERKRAGRAFIYTPVYTKDAFTQSRMSKIADSILERFSEPSLSYLVDRMAQIDPHRLDDLEAAIARRRNRENNTG